MKALGIDPGTSSFDFGGFTILDNRFTNLSDGVHLDIDKDDLTSAYTVNTILIRGNTFNISDDGITFEDVEYGTIRRNMIVNNTGLPPSGVDLDSGSAYNEIYENCFIGNKPYQAVDDGTNNTFNRNFWNEWNGSSGPYEIAGTANNSDNNPRDACRLGEEAPAPAQVPALTPIGLVALVGLLSAIAALTITRKRKRR